MIQQKAQNPDYWDDEFVITPDDLQHLSTLLVEDELPRPAEELGHILVLYRCRQEKALIERAMSKGTPYQPKGSYEEGESIVFPALEYRVGKVVGKRIGLNPEYDEFQVVQVEFETGKVREFASELAINHPLNREDANTAERVDLHSPDELAALYGPSVGEKLEARLKSEPDFIRLAGEWFPKDLLVEVHIGHLNLAEAVLDMANGGPLPTEDLLGDLELPEEITPQLRIFSLNYALQEDERFDEVGPSGEVLWFLSQMEPEKVQSTPICLQYEPLRYDSALLTTEMRDLERQLNDEWSTESGQTKLTDPITVTLTYPHWKSGTLPLSKQLENVFPTGRTHRIHFTFVDGDTGEEMPGWVVCEDRYVCGLEEWYEENGILVGTYLELEQSEDPGKILVRPRKRRSRREWVRVALPVDGRLTFEMRKQLITCDYDELLIVAEESPDAMKEIQTKVRENNLSLNRLVAEIFPELAKLSTQGNVHAATLYSAANFVLRTPPGPMLAELVASGTYAPVGNNYWVIHANPDKL